MVRREYHTYRYLVWYLRLLSVIGDETYWNTQSAIEQQYRYRKGMV
jgi:hypothetical protein